MTFAATLGFDKALTQSFMWLLSRTSQICSSLFWRKGSRLDLKTRSFFNSWKDSAARARVQLLSLLPDSPAEKNWVLGDYGELASEVGQPNAANVYTINQDGSATALH